MILLIAFISLIIGSILARVMKLYPLQLQRDADIECYQHLHLELPEKLKQSVSPWKLWNKCNVCQQTRSWYTLLPVLGSLLKPWQGCGHAVPWRVLLVELICLAITLVLYAKFGLGYRFYLSVVFTYGLILLFGIDVMYHQLPDVIVISLLWIGLLASPFMGGKHSPFWTTKAAFFGYASMWLLAKLYWLVRKEEGMGHGDFKMFAMVGAWVGLWSLWSTMLIALVTGAIYGLSKAVITKHDSKLEFAFGPWIALAVWPCLFYGAYGLHLLDAIKKLF